KSSLLGVTWVEAAESIIQSILNEKVDLSTVEAIQATSVTAMDTVSSVLGDLVANLSRSPFAKLPDMIWPFDSWTLFDLILLLGPFPSWPPPLAQQRSMVCPFRPQLVLEH